MKNNNNEPFDLIEFQQRARTIADPKKLFALLEDVHRRYERNEIGKYELEEMKEVIDPALQALAALRRQVDQSQTTEPLPNSTSIADTAGEPKTK